MSEADYLIYRHTCDDCWCGEESDRRLGDWPHDSSPSE